MLDLQSIISFSFSPFSLVLFLAKQHFHMVDFRCSCCFAMILFFRTILILVDGDGLLFLKVNFVEKDQFDFEFEDGDLQPTYTLYKFPVTRVELVEESLSKFSRTSVLQRESTINKEFRLKF